MTDLNSTGWSAKCCFDSLNKEFLERGRIQGLVIMVFTLAGMMIGFVLILRLGWLVWTVRCEDERYVLGVWMDGVYVLWM